jgi:chromosome partitioning protein
MRTIALVNQKGGVGKTTTTVNLAAALAAAKRRVLIIDLDPQHSSSTWYQATRQEKGAYSIFADAKAEWPAMIAPTGVDGVSIVPSSPMMYTVERALAAEPGAEHTLRLRLQKLPHERYDYALIDCPPSLGLLTLNALTAATEVFVPVEAHVLGLHGLDKLTQTVQIVRERLNPSIRMTGIIACRVKAQTRHAQEVIADIRERFPEVFFQTMIRENIRLSECPSQGVPITSYAPSSNGAEDYLNLAHEVIAQEKGGKIRAKA